MAKSPNAFEAALAAPISAKQLVLGLFGALDDETLPISKLIVGARTFNMEETAVRMAANRLVNDGVLALVQRGIYRIGAEGTALYEASRAWQQMEDRLQDWSGEWVCVHVSHLGRSNRKALRSRHRAFRLRGFAELEDGLWLRPSNLSLSTAELAAELKTLGLDEDAILLHVTELAQQRTSNLSKLWDCDALEASYRSANAAMANSEATLKFKTLEGAAREVHKIGSCVVNILTHDPLLPDSFVDTSLRRAVFNDMLAYNELGKSIWMDLFSETEVAPRANSSTG